jgi:hypothetical protein
MRTIVGLAAAFAVAASATPAVAQTAREQAVFDMAVQAFGKSGRIHLYQCKGPSGRYDGEDHHDEALTGIAREMAAGDEGAVAARSGCRRYDDGPSQAYFGTKLIGQAAQSADAIWLVGEVTESHPQATGYSFEAIVRIPTTPRAAVPAAR